MQIAIAGAGKVGYYLAKSLIDRHQVTLIERDRDLCEKVAEDLGITVVVGDAVKLRVLEDAEVRRADVFVAATGKDEANLIASQIAQDHLQVPKVIARVNNPRNEPVFRALNIPITVSSTAVITQLIQQEVSVADIRTLLTLERGNLAIVEVQLAEDAPVADKMVADIAGNLPRNCVLVTLMREEAVIIPRGDTVLAAGDRVLAITTLDKAADLQKALVGH
ncbi:MAG: TrkA family potassium uptake protein [Firmicutes bacterium]|nr:TrkA family potassium uptake protein [Bacillota bacterium]